MFLKSPQKKRDVKIVAKRLKEGKFTPRLPSDRSPVKTPTPLEKVSCLDCDYRSFNDTFKYVLIICLLFSLSHFLFFNNFQKSNQVIYKRIPTDKEWRRERSWHTHRLVVSFVAVDINVDILQILIFDNCRFPEKYAKLHKRKQIKNKSTLKVQKTCLYYIIIMRELLLCA